MGEFETVWNRFHPGCLPLRDNIVCSDACHWVRFHALPASKRYADTDEERRIILARMNALAMKVLGENVPCWMVEASTVHASPCDNLHGLTFLYRRHVDEIDLNFCSGLTAWQMGRFDTLLGEIADDRGPVTLWMSVQNGAVFSPYDGGADLFLPTEIDRARLVHAFGDWLSPRPDGM
jgi:hypothetical protein